MSMKFAWACGIALIGVISVGVSYTCVLIAFPQKGIASDWTFWVAILPSPYMICAVGCWFFRLRLVRHAATVVGAIGALMTAAFVAEASIVNGGRVPAMLHSLCLACALLVVQYTAAVAAFVAGFAYRAGGNETVGPTGT
jgi:hypothetical protein